MSRTPLTVLTAFSALLALAACDKKAEADAAPAADKDAKDDKAEEKDEGAKPAEGAEAGENEADKPAEPAADAATAGWVDFESTEGKFTARFPKTPKTQNIPTPTPAGNIDQTMIMADDNGISYGVSFADYPEEATKATPIETMLDGARDGAVGNINGTLKSEKQIKLGEYDGRELEVTASAAGQDVVVHQQMFVVKNRLYQLIVVRLASAESKDQTFFDNFKLTE